MVNGTPLKIILNYEKILNFIYNLEWKFITFQCYEIGKHGCFVPFYF